MFTPVDRKTDSKSSMLNFSPISVLSCFSEASGNILKTQFTEKLSKLFSLFIYV